jgi:Ner family transcriptional regulator
MADVKAAIQKRGSSLSALARANGFDDSYLRAVLLRPLPRGEAIIAAFLGVKPKTIWPQRYDAKGNPKSARRRTVFMNRRTG